MSDEIFPKSFCRIVEE